MPLGSTLGIIASSFEGLDPATIAYINRVVALGGSFNGTETAALDAWFRGMKTNNLHTRFDIYGLYWNNGIAAAAVNMASPGTNDMQVVGSPSFVARSGITGAASGYMQSVTNMSAFTNFTQNSAYMGADYINVTAQNISYQGNATTNRMQPNADGGGNAQIVNNSYAAGTNYRAGVGNGYHSASRTASTTLSIRKNGVQQGTDTGGVASTAVAAATYKTNGGINGNATAATMTFHCVGAPVSLAEEAILLSLLATFKANF